MAHGLQFQIHLRTRQVWKLHTEMNWIDNAIGTHARALIIRSNRAEVLATNIANADTPGFKARDLDFRSVLEQSKTNSSIVLTVTNSHHIAISTAASPQLFYRNPGQLSVAGNTVDIDVEQAAFTENSLRYMATLSFLDGSIKGLKMALRGE